MFGYILIKESEYDELRRHSVKYYQLYSLHYWFSGFKEVYKLLNMFAKGEVNHLNISSVRIEFGRSLGLDEYGEPLNKDEVVG